MPTEMLIENEEDIEVTPSCGNVFADLDLPDPELLLAKAKLCVKISRLIRERRLTRPKAAKLMGLTTPEVSDLLRGRLDGFTLDHLFRSLDALGQEVGIVVRPKQTRGGSGSDGGLTSSGLDGDRHVYDWRIPPHHPQPAL